MLDYNLVLKVGAFFAIKECTTERCKILRDYG